MCHPKGYGIVPWFQTKMGRQSLYPFSEQNGEKKKPFGAVNAYVVYIKEYPLESSLTPRTKLLARLNSFCEHYFQGEWKLFSSVILIAR